jgi:hypothetical protein
MSDDCLPDNQCTVYQRYLGMSASTSPELFMRVGERASPGYGDSEGAPSFAPSSDDLSLVTLLRLMSHHCSSSP